MSVHSFQNDSRISAHQAVVALGSNLGDREKSLLAALKDLALLGEIRATSHFYETPYEGNKGPQAAYLNAATLLSTDKTVWEFFEGLLGIEKSYGRLTKGDDAPRVIDLDLIFFDNIVADYGDLILPHPRMHLRRFVLDPVADVAPEWVHPVFRRTVRVLGQR